MKRLRDWIYNARRYRVYQLKGEESRSTYLVRGPRGVQWKLVPVLDGDECEAYIAVSLAPETPWHSTPIGVGFLSEATFARPIEEDK